MWSNGIITMSGRPLSKVPWGERFAGHQLLTLFSGQNASQYLKLPGFQLYFMVHSVKLLFPFDLAEATFLIPTPLSGPVSTHVLIVWQAHQLQKWLEIMTAYRNPFAHHGLHLAKDLRITSRIKSTTVTSVPVTLYWYGICRSKRSWTGKWSHATLVQWLSFAEQLEDCICWESWMVQSWDFGIWHSGCYHISPIQNSPSQWCN